MSNVSTATLRQPPSSDSIFHVPFVAISGSAQELTSTLHSVFALSEIRTRDSDILSLYRSKGFFHRSRKYTIMTVLRLSFLLLVLLVGAQGASAAFDSDEEKKWVQIHGWLMWASMGFLLPLGILLIRWTKPMIDTYETPSSARVWTLFYLHIVCQILAIALASGGVAVLFLKVGTEFNFTHQRLGLAIMCLVWCQPLIGLLRPSKGSFLRSVWCFFHWLFGTGALFLGIINMYIGIRIYEYLSMSSIRTLNIVFSVQIAVMCFFYLLQDSCGDMVNQGRQHKPLPQHSRSIRL